MSTVSNWPSNRLLVAVPARNLKRLLPDLEYIRCERKQVLLDADSSLDHVFFPDSGVVSLVAVYADGSTGQEPTMEDTADQSPKARLGIIGLDDILLGGLQRNRMFLFEGMATSDLLRKD